MASIDLTGTAVERCEITSLLQSALHDAINALEWESAANAPERNRSTETTIDVTQPSITKPTMAHIITPARNNTPVSQLALSAETFAEEGQLDPKRNLADDLESTTPAPQRYHNSHSNSNTTQENGKGGEDVRMGTSSNFLRGTPERTEERPTRKELNHLTAQVKGLRKLQQGNRRAITNLQQKQEKFKDTVDKVKVLEEKVKENSSTLMKHSEAIKSTTESTQKMVAKMERVSQAVQSQGKKAMDQFETLKMLI